MTDILFHYQPGKGNCAKVPIIFLRKTCKSSRLKYLQARRHKSRNHMRHEPMPCLKEFVPRWVVTRESFKSNTSEEASQHRKGCGNVLQSEAHFVPILWSCFLYCLPICVLLSNFLVFSAFLESKKMAKAFAKIVLENGCCAMLVDQDSYCHTS